MWVCGCVGEWVNTDYMKIWFVGRGECLESQRQRKRVRERGGKRARGRERNRERKHKSAKLISSNSQFEKKNLSTNATSRYSVRL